MHHLPRLLVAGARGTTTRILVRAVLTPTAALLLGVAFTYPPTAGAYYAGGGKDADKGNDCLIGYGDVDPDQITVDDKGKRVFTCVDCDLTCDHDGSGTANGSCLIQLGVCINQSGVEGCTPPGALDKASAKAKVKGVTGADGKVVIDTSQLLEGSVCGGFVHMTIPIKDTNKGPKDGKASFNLAASVKKNQSEGTKARGDKDKLTIVCEPRPENDPCPTTTTTTSTSTTTTTATFPPGCVSSSAQFCDLGDGTVFDRNTALQWEKKATTVGSGVNAADLHDVDNLYSWAGWCSVTTSKFCQPNLAAETACKAQTDEALWGACEQCGEGEGTCNVDPFSAAAITTVWNWLSQVNTANYAGHNDWRLPSEAGCNTCYDGGSCTGCLGVSEHELETILLEPYPCGGSPCIDSIFGPTAANLYWSSSTDTAYPWLVGFGDGIVQLTGGEVSQSYVRVVRGGS